jgi:universal stress protein A
MIARKILFPTDFSPASHGALHWATSLARDSEATLLIAHVEEPPMAYGGGELYYAGTDEVTQEELKKTLLQVVPTDHNVAYDHILLVGDPATAIVHAAEKEEADLIVMGTHGRSGLSRLLMGSVAETVIRKAKCPVLTIKQPAEVHATV